LAANNLTSHAIDKHFMYLSPFNNLNLIGRFTKIYVKSCFNNFELWAMSYAEETVQVNLVN